jgi:hypothetical protein
MKAAVLFGNFLLARASVTQATLDHPQVMKKTLKETAKSLEALVKGHRHRPRAHRQRHHRVAHELAQQRDPETRHMQRMLGRQRQMQHRQHDQQQRRHDHDRGPGAYREQARAG